MTSEEIKRRIAIDPDFVFFPRFDNSLKKLKDRYPAEAPDKIIAMALQLEDEQVEAMWDKIIRACKRRI
jgi:hypothetical protein